MVLSSQTPRAGTGGAYARSGRRSSGRWKAALILLVAAGAAYVVFFRGGGDDAGVAAANGDTEEQTGTVGEDDTPGDDADSGVGTRSTADVRPRFEAGEPQEQSQARTPPQIERLPPGISATAGSPTDPDIDSVAKVSVDTEPARPSTTAQGSTRPNVLTTTQTSADVAARLTEGMSQLDRGDTIAGRTTLSSLLLGSVDQLAAADADRIRERLADLNAELVFSPTVVPDDPATSSYRVQPGDLLGSIARRANVPYPLLEMINGIDARRMRADQNLKLLNGPIHARVDKSSFVMDVYLIGTDGQPVFLAAFPVGLGVDGNTPLGQWTVANGKVTNPDWRNPQTNEYFPANDPDNPIGEYWIPITGVDGDAVGRTGFGIHGTTDPESIGRNLSMGCVRLADADIALVYHMLSPHGSTIDIVP